MPEHQLKSKVLPVGTLLAIPVQGPFWSKAYFSQMIKLAYQTDIFREGVIGTGLHCRGGIIEKFALLNITQCICLTVLPPMFDICILAEDSLDWVILDLESNNAIKPIVRKGLEAVFFKSVGCLIAFRANNYARNATLQRWFSFPLPANFCK